MPKKSIKNVAIRLRPSSSEDLDNLVTNLSRWLFNRKKEVFFLVEEQERLKKILANTVFKKVKFIHKKDFFKIPELIITLGGDGTLIGVCRESQNNIPIMAINKGRLGFVTQYTQAELFECLEPILKGKMETLKKPLYKAWVEKSGKTIFSSYFFNDAVITQNGIARMIGLNIEAEEEIISQVSGDGLIISTTVGSTAYSLAAGGPIVHPEVNALILTPINPHSLGYRPIVIPNTFKLKVKLARPAKAVILTLDGQEVFDLSSEDEVKISKSNQKSAYIIKNPERNYFRSLRDKFFKPKVNL